MKSRNIILAVAFSLLLIVGMMPIIPVTAYADDSQAADPKAEMTEIQEPVVQLDHETRRQNMILEEIHKQVAKEPADTKAPVTIGSVEFTSNKPGAWTYLSVNVYDTGHYYIDPQYVNCQWSWGDPSSGWHTITELPSMEGYHDIIVPGEAKGKYIRVQVTTSDTSVCVGSVTGTTSSKVVSSRLDDVDLVALGNGFYVGSEVQAAAYYVDGGNYYWIWDGFIWYDYYVGEGSSWTQIPDGTYNWYTYIPFEAEGKYIKVVAHVMAEQDDVTGGPVSWTYEDRIWVYPIDDYFHDETVPSGWATIDMDGDGLTWEAKTGKGTYSLSGFDGLCVASASYYYAPVDPDNWLISPTIHVPPYATLEWYVTGDHSTDYFEEYDVYIGQGFGPDMYTWEYAFHEKVGTFHNYQKRHISLASYAGKDIHIAFRHHDCTDQMNLLLDGVHIESPLVRVYGNTRYDTAIDIANRYMSLLEGIKVPLVIVSTGDDFADALSGSTPSIKYHAPVILIGANSQSSQDKAMNFIENHLADSGGVILLGGDKAIPEAFEDRVAAMIDDPYSPGTFMERLAGTNRYDTNLKILNKIGYIGDTILICDGTNYADAAIASATGIPVMLVKKNGLTEDQKTFLQSNGPFFIYVIGGEVAVTEEVFNQLKPYANFGEPERIAGKNRAETAVEVANMFFSSSEGPDTVVFAYGKNFPDCICGGLLAHELGAPILYGDDGSSPSYTNANTAYIQGNKKIGKGFVLGGPKLVTDKFAMDLIQLNFSG